MEEKIDNKHIKKYILKAILYIAFLWFIYDIFLIIPDVILALFYSILPENLTVSEEFENICVTSLLYAPIVFSPITCYVIAKLFGIFKYIDKSRNIITKFLALILVSFLSFLILFLKNSYNNSSFKISLCLSLTVFGLIPAFLLYKFFKYLTKKYPTPFEKIGYYCSIEFYKGLFRRKNF